MTFQVYPEPDQRIPPPPPIDLGKVCFLAVLIAGLLVGASAIAHGQTAPGNNAITPHTAVEVSVNALANRHVISPYIYGANFPPSQAYIKNAGVTLSRWGGNSSSRYNWKLNVTNLD